jgi:uncharacterized repeat protein (TIGR01451 family)
LKKSLVGHFLYAGNQTQCSWVWRKLSKSATYRLHKGEDMIKNYISYVIISLLLAGLFILPPGYSATQTPRGKLNITIDADPVFPDTANRCGSTTPAWFFKMTLAETGGVAVNISEYRVDFYDDNLNFINSIRRLGSEFASSFDDCGAPTARIAANSQVCGFQCIHLGGRRSGTAVFTFSTDSVDFCVSKVITLRGSNQEADLSVTTAISGEAVSSRRLLYTIKVLNNGPMTATGVTLKASTPPGATFSSIGLSQGSSTTPPAGGTGAITCFLDSIGPDSEVIVSLVVNVTAPSDSTLNNTVSVTSTSNDPNLEDNSVTDTVFVGGGIGGPGADPSITTASTSGTITAGTRLTYNVTFKNSGPGTGGIGFFIIQLPVGTTFASIATNNAVCQSPTVGTGGAVVCTAIVLPVNGTAGVTVTVNVLTTPGSPLSNKAEIIEGDLTQKTVLIGCVGIPLQRPGFDDPNSNNNSGVATTQVQGGSIVNLFWQQPSVAPSNADAARNAAPNLIRVNPANSIQEAEASADSIVPEDENGCTLVRVSIYKSDQPNVQITLANLWKVVAPDKVQAAMAAAPAGSYFRLTDVWKCGNSSVESGPSPERNSAGALIPFISGTVKQSKALIIMGESFSSGAKLLINGVQQKTTVESSSRLFCKKAGKKVRSGDKLRVRNPDGGLSPETTYP